MVALNLGDPVWVVAEIAQVNTSKGHLFVELVQQATAEEGGATQAQAGAVVWENTLRNVRRERGREIDALFRAGSKVRLRVRADYHVRYGFKLIVEDADPSFTLGQLEAERRATVEHLEAAGDLVRNKLLDLSLVPLRLAVISSPEAAGYLDFTETLDGNSYGFRFRHRLFATGVQGDLAPALITKQLRAIGRRREEFDAVAVIRGGGARLDLAAFDDLEVCRAAAKCPLPIICGLGHESDETILDLVAHTRLKTPTAAAEFFITRLLRVESFVEEARYALHQLVRSRLHRDELVLTQVETKIDQLSHRALADSGSRLTRLEDLLSTHVGHRLLLAEGELAAAEGVLHALRPETTLARGYSLLSQRGKIISNKGHLDLDKSMEVRMAVGKLKVKAVRKKKRKKSGEGRE